MPRRIDPGLLNFAQAIRQEPTPNERAVWTGLAGQHLCGFKWRRQAVIDEYIVDFYCPEAALIVEIDGAMHDAAHDALHDAVLAARGLLVVRFGNQQVGDDCEAVLGTILVAARERVAVKVSGRPQGDVRVLARGEGTLPPTTPSLKQGGGVAVVLGLDPGLAATGWGIVEATGNRLRHVAHGTVKTKVADPLAVRLLALHDGLAAVIAAHECNAAAVEEVFVNSNPQSTLKLGQARGVVVLAAARGGLPVTEYATRLVRKAIVGTGSADKTQVHAMVERLLPGVRVTGADAADALAVAIAHAHLAASARVRGVA